MERILEITNPMLLSVGIIFIVCGLIMYIFPPKKINSLYGYRTAASMKSQAKWDFAQKYGAKVMICTGFIFVIISFTKYFFNTNENTDLAIGMFVMIIGSFAMIPIVDKKLKNLP
ncbi:MAG: SdpI family protein [Myroides sp.]|nr:SdpI family protein [uncultured Flavobacterium sp.]MDO5637268.1 SdpI family protein [Myroides sp.]